MRKTFTAEFKAKVALEAARGDKKLSELATQYDVHPNQISQWRKALFAGLPEIFGDKRRRHEKKVEEDTSKLYEQIGRLKVEVDWLKKNLASSDVEARRAMVDRDHDTLSIVRQCQLLSISRSGYYYCAVDVPDDDLGCMRLIDETFTKRPFYGSRRLRDELQEKGYTIGRDRVRRLMSLMGLEAVYPKKRLSLQNKEHRVYPYLLRNLPIVRPDQVWCSDITYIRLHSGFAYLTAVMDWHSRYVLSWELSLAMDMTFVMQALQAALMISTPEIFNTDQGSQYTSDTFTGTLKEAGIRISMDGRGRAFDNIMIERLWRTVKYEEVFLREYANYFAARESLGEYFEFYNEERRHSRLDNRTPAAVYWAGRQSARRAG